MGGNETDDVIHELLNSFIKRYQEGLETKMRGSEFIYDSVDLLYYSLHKISINRGSTNVKSPDWIKVKMLQ